jgi:hypothetical protein
MIWAGPDLVDGPALHRVEVVRHDQLELVGLRNHKAV